LVILHLPQNHYDHIILNIQVLNKYGTLSILYSVTRNLSNDSFLNDKDQ